MSGVEITTYNMRHALKTGKTDQDTNKLAKLDQDYLCWQEINTKAKSHRIKELTQPFGYDLICFPDVPGGGKTPISYKTDRKRLIDSGHIFLCPKMGEEGAGPATAVEKRGIWGLFRDRGTGNKELVLNVHLPPSVYVPARRKLSKEAVGNITKFILDMNDLWEPKTFITGDMNVNYNSQKGPNWFAELRSEGYEANWERFDPEDYPSTHPEHNSYIDWVISNMIPKTQDVLLGYNSDHRPVKVRY